MSDLRERDAMICRSCGNEERASEGYPCKDCGTFICIMCVFKGVVRCEACAQAADGSAPSAPAPAAVSNPAGGALDWPEH
jgi:hypothetical protein